MKSLDVIGLSACGSIAMLGLLSAADSGESSLLSSMQEVLTGSEWERVFIATDNISVTESHSSNTALPSGFVTLKGEGNSVQGNGYEFYQNIGSAISVTVENWGTMDEFGKVSGGGWQGFINTNSNGKGFFVLTSANTLNITNSAFTENTFSFSTSSAFYGGIVNNYSGGVVNISGSLFSGNVVNPPSSSKGAKHNGLVFSNNGVATVTDTTFSYNKNTSGNAYAFGGAIYNHSSGVLTITNTDFIGNVATKGGALYNNGGSVTISDGLWSGNDASGTSTNSGYGGGAIWGKAGSITIDGATFENNTGRVGGAIMETSTGSYLIKNSAFTGNIASYSGGGAIDAAAASSVWQIENCTFEGNAHTYSSMGGAGALSLGTKVSAAIIDSDFIGNTAARSQTNTAGAIKMNSAIVIAARDKDVLFTENVNGDGNSSYETRTAIQMTNASAVLNLNAAEGRSIIFKGDGITSTAAGNDVYINASGVDSNVIEADVQEAGTTGTVQFIRDDAGVGSLMQSVDLYVEGGSLLMEGTTLGRSTVTVAGEGTQASFADCTLTYVADAYAYSANTVYDSTVSVAEGASALVVDCTMVIKTSSTPQFYVDSLSSLTLGGAITIDLSYEYDGEENPLVLDESYTLNFVSFADAVEEAAVAEGAASLLSDSGASALSLRDDLRFVFLVDGEEVAYTGTVNTARLLSEGVISFMTLPAGDAVPEPSTATLGLLARTALMQRRRRR